MTADLLRYPQFVVGEPVDTARPTVYNRCLAGVSPVGQKALGVGPSGTEVAYECFGEADTLPVLLIMGLGSPMLGWHEGFCAELVACSLRPIRFDNP